MRHARGSHVGQCRLPDAIVEFHPGAEPEQLPVIEPEEPVHVARDRQVAPVRKVADAPHVTADIPVGRRLHEQVGVVADDAAVAGGAEILLGETLQRFFQEYPERPVGHHVDGVNGLAGEHEQLTFTQRSVEVDGLRDGPDVSSVGRDDEDAA